MMEYLILAAVGLAAGAINVLAGGGSFLTLPMLIFLGLPAGVANGTNRVGILAQNVGAVWGFKRHGIPAAGSLLWAALPASAGALIGTWLAMQVSDQAFEKILALLMVLLSLWSIWSSKPRDRPLRRGSIVFLGASFLVIGVYGGFIQAGVGFLILAATSTAGMDLVRGNAMKVLTVLCFTVLSLAIFAWTSRVDWGLGCALGAGTFLGGQLGVRLTVLKGHRWVRGVVTLTVILFAVKLWLGSS